MSTYVTLAWMDNYFQANNNFLDDWTSFTPVERQRYIDLAERVIDRGWDYIGRKVNHAQKTEFPRNFDSYIVDTYNLYNPLVQGNKKIPVLVQEAVASVCKELVKVEDFEQLIILQEVVNATSIGVSSINVAMEGKGFKFKEARLLLSPFLKIDNTLRCL